MAVAVDSVTAKEPQDESEAGSRDHSTATTLLSVRVRKRTRLLVGLLRRELYVER